MTFLRGKYSRALLLICFAGCSEPAVDSTPAEESTEESAVKRWTKAGPGTVTRVICEEGSPRMVVRGSSSTVECRGPSGSTTTTSIECEGGEAKSVSRSDRIVVFCPERAAPTAAAR